MPILTVEKIKESIIPIAEKYEVQIVYLFGSYARREATDGSDVDLAYLGTNSKARGSKKISFQKEIENQLGVGVDLLRVENFSFSFNKDKNIVQNFYKDRIVLYQAE